MFLLIAGVIGLLVILAGVVVLLLLRHKHILSQEEPGDQRGLALLDIRPGYAQGYSRGTISAEQDPWPWAKKVSPPPVGYYPTTPVPEVLRVPASPMTPMPEMPRVPSNSMTPVPEMLGTPDVLTAPVPEVPAAPVVPVQDSLQRLPIFVPDPTLEVIMRQVQVGLFATTVQHKGQKDREAVL